MKLSLIACFVMCFITQAQAANSKIATPSTESNPSSSLAKQPLPLADVTEASPKAGNPADVWFNPALLGDNGGPIADLSAFQSGKQMPGVYLVDIYLNGKFIASRNQAFIARPDTTVVDGNSVSGASHSDKTRMDDSGLIPALTIRDLESFGVKAAVLEQLGQNPSSGDDKLIIDPLQQVNLEATIASSSTAFDFNHQRLDINIPQASLEHRSVGEVPEYMWDEGINAFLLSYNFTGSKNSGNEASSDSNFLSLNTGLNLGPWRLRDQSTWNKTGSNGNEKNNNNSNNSGSNSNDGEGWEHVNTTLSRAIIPFKSKLTIGGQRSGTEVFDSIGFTGVQLASDDSMHPDSQQGYAPVIRGIAKGNAKVSIKQGTILLYQTYVSAGPFEIDDLYSTYDNGDLLVEVEESDGSITSYTVPYTAVPNMLREGHAQYGLSAGRYRAMNDEQNEPSFVQGAMVMGLPKDFTLFGGTQLSSNYQSVAMGVSKNFGDWGGVSADITHAATTLPDDTDSKGQSLRFLYSKSFEDYGTDLRLVNTRYSTDGFYTFADSTYKSMSGFYTPDNIDPSSPSWAYQYNLNYAKQGRLEVNLTQDIGDMGSIFLNLSKQTYWGTDDDEKLAQLGYSGSWGSVTYNVAYNYTKSQFQPSGDQIFSLNLSVPLGQMLGSSHSAMYANYSSSYDDEGNSTHNVGINGVALDDDSLNYNIQQGYDTQGRSYTGATSLRYTGGRGNASLGYNYGENHKQVNYGLSGGIVAHSEGITFSQPLGDTNVLVAAKGADDVRVKNNPGNHTDWRGYSVVPYANIYRNNRIEIDINSLGSNVDIDQAVSNVVPTEGAIVKAEFAARVGVRALMTLTHAGHAVPFGAQVTESSRQSTGIVSDDGVVYLSGLPLSGTLSVKWGDKVGQSCSADYNLPEDALTKNIARAQLICR